MKTLAVHFEYDHLQPQLRNIGKACSDLAKFMNSSIPECEEKHIGMRKLLEAKDCFVRAKLFG